jgi:hypothetical protein
MSASYAELRAKLHFYTRDYASYTKCLSRGIELLVSSRPEEIVRQVLLYYLIHESGLYPGGVDIRVEQDNLDVALYKRPEDESFLPWRPPTVIIEVKRDEANLREHESQLFGYMKQRRTDAGVLFNGNEILGYNMDAMGGTSMCLLDSIASFGEWLRLLICKSDLDLAAYFCARKGDIAAFRYLAEKYGRYAVNKFTFSLKRGEGPIVGCFFRFEEQHVYYDCYGKYAKKSFTFGLAELYQLISVLY